MIIHSIKRYPIRFISLIFVLLDIVNLLQAQPKIYGGVSIPIGSFAGNDSATGGFARPGFALGVEYLEKFYFNSEVGISGILCIQPFDAGALVRSQPHIPPGTSVRANPWIIFWPTGSLGYSYSFSSLVSAYGKFHAGICYGVYPEVNSIQEGTLYTQNMAIDISFGWGIGAGAVILKKYDVGIKLLSARPKYDLNTQGGGTSTNDKQLRQTAMIEILIGIIL